MSNLDPNTLPRPTMGVNVEAHFDKRAKELWIIARTSQVDSLDMQYGYLHMFANWSLRQLVNMVPQQREIAEILAAGLVHMHDEVQEMATTDSFYGVQFVNRPGKEGRRCFRALLALAGGEYGEEGFYMDQKGFGMGARGIEGNAMVSVMGFGCWMAQVQQRWTADPWYLPRLGHIGGSCGDNFLEGRVTISNQHDIAHHIVKTVWETTTLD